jgi:hypothetical protein
MEEKLHLGVSEHKALNIIGLEDVGALTSHNPPGLQGLLSG